MLPECSEASPEAGNVEITQGDRPTLNSEASPEAMLKNLKNTQDKPAESPQASPKQEK